MKFAIMAIAFVISFSAMCYNIAIYHIEEAKQTSFMMKACVDSGGSWLRYWNNLPYCKKEEPK